MQQKTGKPIKKNGRQIYNLLLWDKGFSTVVVIEKENYLRTINYMIHYVTKENNIGYNQKKYYCTNNLDFKSTKLGFMDVEQLVDILLRPRNTGGHIEKYKDNSRMCVFRILNDRNIDGMRQLTQDEMDELPF